MSTKLIGVTTQGTPRFIHYGGLNAWCTGTAYDRDGTVYVSLIGRVTAVSAIWAAFQSGTTLWPDGFGYVSKRPKLEGTTYHTLRTRLPKSGWLHMVVLHTQATMRNLPDQTFFVLSASDEPPLDAFWAQWNNALPFPTLPAWKPILWEQGIAQDLIYPCTAEGAFCWKVLPAHDIWSEILQSCARQHYNRRNDHEHVSSR